MSIRVLIVDDIPDERRLVRTALRFREGFVVAGEASDGKQAVELAASTAPDIVVLDIGLPDIAGQEVLTGIRIAAPTAKVIVFSGTEPDASAGVAERVEGYVLKDADLDYLIALLEALGREPTEQLCETLPRSLRSAGSARAFASEALDRWGLPELADDLLLVVTELVANAVTHAGTSCELRLSALPAAVRVEVIDYGAGTPDPMPPSSTRNHGRGLHMIDAVTAAWGVHPLPDKGKLVWAELPRPVG